MKKRLFRPSGVSLAAAIVVQTTSGWASTSIVNVSNSLCMDDQGSSMNSSNPIVQNACGSSSSQQWELNLQSDGSYALIDQASKLCLDIPGASTNSGAKLQQYSCNGTGAQKFKINSAGSGIYTIVNVNSSKCVDVPGSSSSKGLQLQQYACNGTKAQSFKLSLPGSAPSTPPPSSRSDNLTLNMSEDAYTGDAQFTVSVDGVQQGGTQTATASHAAGGSQSFSFSGSWGGGNHTVAVTFLNDAYGGSTSTDRNLYIDSISFEGAAQANSSAALYSNGTASFTVSGSGGSPAPAPSQAPPPPPPASGTSISGSAFYVSPSGSDSADGSKSNPFQSLGKAQQAAQGSSTKAIVLRGGTYNLGSAIALGGSDNGEAFIGYPGETAIIDAGGGDAFDLGNAQTISIENLTIQNVKIGVYINDHSSGTKVRWNHFKNCVQNCVNINYYSGSATIDNNTMDGGGTGAGDSRGLGTYHGAVFADFTTSGNVVSHNLIQNYGSAGIAFAGTQGQNVSNNTIDRNILKNVNTILNDSGAIYIMDRAHVGVGNQITNNYVDGNGTVTQSTKAIYLDDDSSNVTVTGNVCRNCGQYGIQYHGGDHNVVKNNVFDLSSGAQLALYQDDTDPGQNIPNYGMGSNVFQNNIVFYSGAPGNSQALWDFNNTFSGSPVSISNPNDSNNVYWSLSGASIPNGGQIQDSAAKYVNPGFANPSAGDYSMPSSSPVFSAIQFSPLAKDLGPLPLPAALPN